MKRAKKKSRKNKLDEMQEQKLLHIERNGMWFVFWGLIAVMIIQIFINGFGCFREIAGEWIVFMCLCLYIVIACIKEGIWDRKLEANVQTNLSVSLISGVITGSILGVISYHNYHDLKSAAATAAITFGEMFALCFLGMSFASWLYKKRVKKLEQEEEEEE